MSSLKNYLIDFCKDEEGLTTVEYAVAGSLIAATVVLSFENLGLAVQGVIDNLTGEITPTAAP